MIAAVIALGALATIYKLAQSAPAPAPPKPCYSQADDEALIRAEVTLLLNGKPCTFANVDEAARFLGVRKGTIRGMVRLQARGVELA